jgi:hypothetical protein
MTIDVFLGSTKEDLERCRQKVRNAVKECGENCVAMESWLPADFDEDPVDVCHRMISESSHYLGIIAFRFGWAPKRLQGRSITWAEFQWAEGKPRFVFVLKRTSRLGQTINAATSGTRDEQDARNQEQFLEEIKRGYYREFESLDDLHTQTIRVVTRWTCEQILGGRKGALRSLADEASREADDVEAASANPSEDEILELGRDRQHGDFRNVLSELADPSVPNRACFLIHGPVAFGQRMLSTRLRKHVEDDDLTPEIHCLLSIKPRWRQHGLVRLIQLIGNELALENPMPETPEALAPRLEQLLEVNDVILEITDMQRFDDGVAGFAQKFWVPLIESLPKRSPHRLVILLTLEQSLTAACGFFLQDPCDLAEGAYTPNRIVKLSALTPFTKKELTVWLRKRRTFDEPDEAWELAQLLIEESDGGKPQLLYTKLRDLHSYF